MMAPINWFTCLALLMAAISIDMGGCYAVSPFGAIRPTVSHG